MEEKAQRAIEYLKMHPGEEIGAWALMARIGENPNIGYSVLIHMTYMDAHVAECDNGAILWVEEL
jgi:hypothetical protein